MNTPDAKKIYQNLIAKGFKTVSGDHKYLEYHYKDKVILHVKIGHGEKELKDHHIGMMRRQCRLSKKEFLSLAAGDMTAAGYLEILKSAGIISGRE
jgi:hypothetical protein